MSSSFHEQYARILRNNPLVRQIRDRYAACCTSPLGFARQELDLFPPRNLLMWMIVVLDEQNQLLRAQLEGRRISDRTNQIMEELQVTLDQWDPPRRGGLAVDSITYDELQKEDDMPKPPEGKLPTDVHCKGCYALGTACGECERCQEEWLRIMRVYGAAADIAQEIEAHGGVVRPEDVQPRAKLLGCLYDIRDSFRSYVPGEDP